MAEDGTPLLSWRVELLPYLDETELYREFRRDEPWDSPHNIKLLDRMPETFRNPNVEAGARTVYLGFAGEGTMFEAGKEIGFGQITDGTSNTILAVEANPDVAVEWTKPVDLPFDKDNPKKNVGEIRPGVFCVVLCDGSTHSVDVSVFPEALSNLIRRNDGRRVDIRRW